MFHSETYVERRTVLQQHMHSGLILFYGNIELPMNYPANTYAFRQDSTFLYYFGIDIPGMSAVIDIDSGKTTIFGTDYELEDIIWMGDQPKLMDWAEMTGADAGQPADALQRVMEDARKAGRDVHCISPYRPEHEALFEKHLGVSRPEPSVELIKAIVSQRSVKSPEEVAEIERAHAITYDMQVTAMRMARSGMSEREIYGRIEGIALAGGAQVSFPIILSVNGQVLHNHHHSNIMKDGDMLINDCGAETLKHYAADITRTIPVSGKFTSAQREIYEIVLGSQLKAIGLMKPGVTFKDIHIASAKYITDGLKSLGLMKGNTDEAVQAGAHALFFPHGLGHMMGLDVHDMENLGENYVGYSDGMERSDQFGLAYLRFARKLEPGFVLTVEPGIYFIPELIKKWQAENYIESFINYPRVEEYLNFGGIRIEDDVLITQESNRVLGESIPKTIAEIEKACTG